MRKLLTILLLFAVPVLAKESKKPFRSHVGQVASFPVRHPVMSGKAIKNATMKVGKVLW